MSDTLPPAIGIIGGSGLYDLEGFENREEITLQTPFGPPSDALVTGTLCGRRVYFLPRHGKGHRILPTELNHRANLWALRSLNVRWIIAVTAVGSLQEHYHPRDIVLPDQLFDRTSRRDQHTFFGRGIVAHVAFGDPLSDKLRALLHDAVVSQGRRVHNGGTYVCMDGPAFSTRAESNAHRQLGFDIIGMTNLPEAKLAREAEICYASVGMVTDFDCWHPAHDAVTVDAVIQVLLANAGAARTLVAGLAHDVTHDPEAAACPCRTALEHALITAPEARDPAMVNQLSGIAGRVLGRAA
jgi:5'-methylthioadenosine phosphorylase